MNIQLHPFIPLFFVNPGYLVTDAERRTERYSNLFAAHILRQHQFNALCGARGWKNKLRLMVDDEYPPASRELGSVTGCQNVKRPLIAVCGGRLLPRKLFLAIAQQAGFLIGSNLDLEEAASPRVHCFGCFTICEWLPRWFAERF
jgi:hypothetical protein